MGVMILGTTVLVGLAFSPGLRRFMISLSHGFIGESVRGADLPLTLTLPQTLQAPKDAPVRESADRLKEMRRPKARSKEPILLELQRIIPFGRSLELIGRVEPGSSLAINDETVEVTADGSFKHFTKQFPASTQKASLIMRATDLAGRTRVQRATHDFGAGEQEE